MIESTTKYNVKNRSSSVVVYRIPETNLRREYAPGEVKLVEFGELEKLTYQPGGRELLEGFLQILEPEVTESLNVTTEPEYNMSEEQIVELLRSGSLDEFLDALDFAPIGVIDLIKILAVKLPLTDFDKRKALKDKTGYDVDKALSNLEAEKTAAQEEVAATGTGRRVPVEQKDAAAGTPVAPARRTSSSKYSVKKEDAQ